MEDDQESSSFGSALLAQSTPSIVSLSAPSVSPSPCRLSSRFTRPNQPVRAARQLAWVSLQGRLVGVEEASSAKTIGGGLSTEEAVAWELFSPIHRILIVAVVAAAAVHSKQNKQIYQLTKSVELRDQVLSSMQKKLDNLCEQVNYHRDQSEYIETFSGRSKLSSCGCQLQYQYKPQPSDSVGNGDDLFKDKLPLTNEAEQEERRMSDLSDWAPSVASSVDNQLNSFALEQDVYSLRKECEKKDATIKELSIVIHSFEVAGSKRITELEDIIRRKNMIITKLKKDMLILEQKVVNLTRLRRPSFSTSSSNTKLLPVMADNLIYDMDSSSSPSSSDSDCPPNPKTQPQPPVSKIQDVPVLVSQSDLRAHHKLGLNKGLVKSSGWHQMSREVSPLKEKVMNQTPDSATISRPKSSCSANGDSTVRRRAPTNSKDSSASQKRWM